MAKRQTTIDPSIPHADGVEQIPVAAIGLDPAHTLRQPDPIWAKRLARTIVDPASCPIELGVPTDDAAWPDGQYMVVNGTRRYTAYTAVSMSDVDGLICGGHRPVAKAGEPPVVAPRFTAQDTLPCIVMRAPWADLLFAAAVANDRLAPQQALDEKSHRRAAEWIFRSRPSLTQREVADLLHCSQSTVRNYRAAFAVRDVAPEESAGLTNELCQAVYGALMSADSPARSPELVAPLLAHWRKSGAAPQALSAKLRDLSRKDLDETVRADYLARIAAGGLFQAPDTTGKAAAPKAAVAASVTDGDGETESAAPPSTAPEHAGTLAQDTLRAELASFFRLGARLMDKAEPDFMARAILATELATMELLPLVERLRSFCQHIEAAVQVESRRRTQNARQPEPQPESEPEPTDEELRAIAGANLDAAMAAA